MPNPVNRFFRSLRRWARSVFGKPPEAPLPPVYWDDSVTLTLSNLVQDTETRASGRVQVISLTDFRASIGDLWDKYANKIMIIVDSTIGRMIGKGNTYIPQGEDAWLLLFPDLDDDKAQERADAIAASIGEKLVGGQFTAHETPMPEASRLDLSTAVNTDGSLNMEAVKLAIGKVRRKQISAVVAQNRAASRTPVSSPATLIRSTADQLKPFYRPAWCAETESIDMFFYRAAAGGADIYANAAPPSNDATILDMTRNATAAFTAMCDSGLNAKMSIPVPLRTLQGASLAEIQKMIIGLRQRERLLRLRLEVVQIPDDVPADMLVAIRELFRPHVREVAFQIDLFALHEQALALDHVMLGVTAPPSVQHNDEHLFQDLLMFRQRAGRRGTYVLGLQSKAHLKRAMNAGIAEVGGPALTEDMSRLPHRVTIVQRETLLAP